MMKKSVTWFFLAMIAFGSLVACTGKTGKVQGNENTSSINEQKNDEMMKFSKKFTNADFYRDGLFQQEVAMQAMKEMLAFYNVPFTDLMEKDMWVTDRGLGDFENVVWGIFG